MWTEELSGRAVEGRALRLGTRGPGPSISATWPSDQAGPFPSLDSAPSTLSTT